MQPPCNSLDISAIFSGLSVITGIIDRLPFLSNRTRVRGSREMLYKNGDLFDKDSVKVTFTQEPSKAFYWNLGMSALHGLILFGFKET